MYIETVEVFKFSALPTMPKAETVFEKPKLFLCRGLLPMSIIDSKSLIS